MKLKLPSLKIKSVKAKRLSLIENISGVRFLLLAMIIFLVGLNLFSQYYYYRLDVTSSRNFTLSKATKNIVNDLEETITITSYYSDNLPPELTPVVRDSQDLLSEYGRIGGNKIKIENYDPKSDDFKTKAAEAGIQEVQFSQLSDDKFALETGYIGLVVEKGDAKEALPVVSNANNLEYEITSRINKISSNEKPKIGIIVNGDAKGLTSGYAQISQLLQSQFTASDVDLLATDNISEYKLLIWAAPKQPVKDKAFYKLDQYLLGGGKVIILADKYSLQSGTPILERKDNDIYKFVEHYGVKVGNAIVLDESNLPVSNGVSQLDYPFWVLTQPSNTDRSLPPFNDLGSVAFFWASNLSSAGELSGRTYTSLMRSTEKSWLIEADTISANPTEIQQTQNTRSDLLVSVEGKQESYFNDKDIAKKNKNHVTTGDKGKLLVAGDSDFISDNYVKGTDQNPVLIMNLVEWVVGGEQLATIRSKNITNRPLKVTDSAQRNALRAINILFAPGLIIIGGIGYNLYRNRRPAMQLN